MTEAGWREEVVRAGWSQGLPTRAKAVGVGGVLKSSPEDFVVEEVLSFEPSGVGPHLYIELQKRGLNTEEVQRRLARAFGISRSQVGFAGRKDRQAVTSQWFSVLCQGEEEEGLAALELEPSIEVLRASRNPNKLRVGMVRKNLFKVTLRDVCLERLNDLPGEIARIGSEGFANYFGPQRFGRGGENVARGASALVAGGRARKRGRFFVSALQSAVFNHYLGSRISDGLDSVCEGDVLQVVTSGGSFVCEDVTLDAPRRQKGEIELSGFLFGSKVLRAVGASLEREDASIDAVLGQHLSEAEYRDALLSLGREVRGNRRPLFVKPEGLRFERLEGQALQFRFGLPTGSYATVLMRELIGQ